jgi:hypothetical protein
MGDCQYRADVAGLAAAGVLARPLAERKAAYAALEAEIRGNLAALPKDEAQV